MTSPAPYAATDDSDLDAPRWWRQARYVAKALVGGASALSAYAAAVIAMNLSLPSWVVCVLGLIAAVASAKAIYEAKNGPKPAPQEPQHDVPVPVDVPVLGGDHVPDGEDVEPVSDGGDVIETSEGCQPRQAADKSDEFGDVSAGR